MGLLKITSLKAYMALCCMARYTAGKGPLTTFNAQSMKFHCRENQGKGTDK